ncbi:ribbon-helix-helix domain-containing protein [Singulisphaera sp. Ch08]|uniref:Ribbon-helix-helix domain-containing protein n=1 Tax=Singulisphaera sp. Ch08 TaxID=3120278 RepID=A0AAU7C8R5_9BACT
MTIRLPGDLERSILEEVHSGHFASVDDAMAEAVRLLLRQRDQSRVRPETAGTGEQVHKPIWQEIAEIAATVPNEEWDKLPADGAEQHDHYIYGTPKRPTAQ